ncbi:hypothetical protein ANO11243_057500 [Dothideomycetidae sp. 11243]|nr:hypothetical protein ANO11243_057500 [fungal sp. No.11243]
MCMNCPAALHLSDSYKELPYFPHALEVLLHDVLDDEVDAQASASGDEPDRPVESQLASLLPFLSSFPSYLDIVLGCARKNELRSWRTLFQHLPPVAELFEQALKERRLKTAGGFLLVLHTFDEERFTAEMIARLLVEAKKENDWDLCKELARFLVGVDASGELLRRSLEGAGMLPADRKVNGLQAKFKPQDQRDVAVSEAWILSSLSRGLTGCAASRETAKMNRWQRARSSKP